VRSYRSVSSVGPSWGDDLFAVKRLYHGFPASSTPHRPVPGYPSPASFILEYGDFRDWENAFSYTIELKEVHVTREAYGPILVLCCWAKGYQEPLYLVSNMATAEEACRWYEKRFRIETFFSDQKSRGFHIHKSHISDVQRLSRLLIAACLAYIWIVYLGSVCEKDRWRHIIHRSKRCDLSLFQLGLRLLEYFLNEELPIPVQFHVTI
jgi:hypothetical protein